MSEDPRLAEQPSAVTDIPRFTPIAYVGDNIISILIFTFCLLGVVSITAVLGVSLHGLIVIAALMTLCFLAGLIIDYRRKATYYQEISQMLAKLDQAVSFESFFEEPGFLEGRIDHATGSALARLSSRNITELRESEEAYRRYIELWIHETKTPIAAVKLMLAKHADEHSAKIAREIERVENQVDQALYYARSTAVATDYAIKEVPLAEAIREACKRNARFLIEHGTTPAIEVPDGLTVLSDEAWLVFMLGQVIVNSSKYGASSVEFRAAVHDEGTPAGRTVLEVVDNGCGIPASDAPRVFERGFIGSVGRDHGSATGMGLYLVAKLCASMGMHVGLASEEGVGTRVIFTFPHDRARKSVLGL